MVKKEPQVQLFVDSLNVFVLKNTPPPATLNTKRLPIESCLSKLVHSDTRGCLLTLTKEARRGEDSFQQFQRKSVKQQVNCNYPKNQVCLASL